MIIICIILFPFMLLWNIVKKQSKAGAGYEKTNILDSKKETY